HNDSSEYSIVVLGQQGVDFLKTRGYEIESSLVDLPDQPSFKSIQALAKHAIDLYSEENIDELNIYYSHYVSVLENKPTTKKVLPLSQEDSSQGHGHM
ncbi:F0F1 ATP synthase subunit gamma, partial [Pseudomonas aeruginosa]